MATEELTVVVTGSGSFIIDVAGSTTADTGGGMVEAVATSSLGTAVSCSACRVGDVSD